jgi:uncharacterized DUF497 family protein
MAAYLYQFEWDPDKAKINFNKHGVHFEQAAQVFRDPLALTIPDEEHSARARWITLGIEMPAAVTCLWCTRSSKSPMNSDASV